MNNKINHEDLAEARQPELAAGQISMVLLAEQVEKEIKGSTESGESGGGRVICFECGVQIFLSLSLTGPIAWVGHNLFGSQFPYLQNKVTGLNDFGSLGFLL